MKKKIFITVLMFTFLEQGFSLNNGTGDDSTKDYPTSRGFRSKRHIPKNITTSYNATSTELSVAFTSNGQGGKVEIYRNGTQVVNVSAAAGTSLNYMLRNYGTGSYTVIVSCGNTVVYSNNVEVK
jgi:hypothetical protein